MLILPAIDLYDKKAVRLYKGDYNEMTVYSNNPIEIARKFQECGAEFIHMVDLEGAKNGTTPNIDEVRKVVEYTDLKVEIGGGIRDEETVQKYIDLGVERVILGTAAVTDDEFLCKMVAKYKDAIAVGVDLKDGYAKVEIDYDTEKGKGEIKINGEFLCLIKMSNPCPVGISYIIMQCAADGDSEGFYLKSLSKE